MVNCLFPFCKRNIKKEIKELNDRIDNIDILIKSSILETNILYNFKNILIKDKNKLIEELKNS